MDWYKYLTLAEDLNGRSETGKDRPEQYSRTAISRAYYSVFHLVKNHFSIVLPVYEQHKELILKLRKEYPVHDESWKTLNQPRIMRVYADYQEHYNKEPNLNNSQLASRAIRLAHEIIKANGIDIRG